MAAVSWLLNSTYAMLGFTIDFVGISCIRLFLRTLALRDCAATIPKDFMGLWRCRGPKNKNSRTMILARFLQPPMFASKKNGIEGLGKSHLHLKQIVVDSVSGERQFGAKQGVEDLGQ